MPWPHTASSSFFSRIRETRLANFFDLGFSPPGHRDKPANDGLWLGPKKSKMSKDILAWTAVAGGIFARQGLTFPPPSWNLSNLSIGVGTASIVLALACFPMAMRWINGRRQVVGLNVVALPFAFGFFLDLASLAAVKIPALWQ